MVLGELMPIIYSVAARAGTRSATFDQLAEEVMELHLAMRGKHQHAPAQEWLEIATIAINALLALGQDEALRAYDAWLAQHA